MQSSFARFIRITDHGRFDDNKSHLFQLRYQVGNFVKYFLTVRENIVIYRLENGICALEIFKPLLNRQKGIWRLYQNFPGFSPPTGCVFQLDMNEDDAYKEALTSNKDGK